MYGSKRKIDSDVNAFKSQKDVFDWDLNALEMYNKEQMKPKEKTYLKQMVQKNLYSSDLFNNNNNNDNVKGNNVGYSNTLPNKKKYYAQSDIFNIKNDNNNSNEKESKRKGNSIRRVNKNAESMSLLGNNSVNSNSNSNNTERGIKRRIATQLQISKDNPFYC